MNDLLEVWASAVESLLMVVCRGLETMMHYSVQTYTIDRSTRGTRDAK